MRFEMNRARLRWLIMIAVEDLLLDGNGALNRLFVLRVLVIVVIVGV